MLTPRHASRTAINPVETVTPPTRVSTPNVAIVTGSSIRRSLRPTLPPLTVAVPGSTQSESVAMPAAPCGEAAPHASIAGCSSPRTSAPGSVSVTPESSGCNALLQTEGRSRQTDLSRRSKHDSQQPEGELIDDFQFARQDGRRGRCTC